MKKDRFEYIQQVYDNLLNRGKKRITKNMLIVNSLFNAENITINEYEAILFLDFIKGGRKLAFNNLNTLIKLGSCYESGTLKNGRKLIANYYKIDNLPNDSLEYIFGKLVVKTTYKQYAPELKSNMFLVYR